VTKKSFCRTKPSGKSGEINNRNPSSIQPSKKFTKIMSGNPPPPQVVNPTLGKDREKLPGWNDPPPLTSNSSGSSSGQGYKLNKRVGYPTASAAATSTETVPGQIKSTATKPGYVLPLSTPPMIQANLAPPPTASLPTAASSTEKSDALAGSSNDVDDTPDVEAVRANLDAVMDRLKSGSDVRKRVDTMLKTKWAAMDPAVKSGVCQLASRLSAGDVDGADKSQRDLATGYPSQCAGWIVVLKRLINESRAALPSTDDGTAVPNTEPTGFMVPLPKE